MRVALAGGGGAEDSRPLDEVFASWIGPQGRLLYWPVALRGIRTFQSCLEWITGTFAPLNISHIAMWTELAGHRASDLEEFDAIYIGGGNTFSLLAELRESGFDRYLKEFALRSRPVYGGSAGAAVLGCDIHTVEHIDQNKVGLTEMNGLDLAAGHAIWVHYQPEDDGMIEAYVRKHQQPVLAISERSGIVLDQAGLRRVGFTPAFRFEQNGKMEV